MSFDQIANSPNLSEARTGDQEHDEQYVAGTLGDAVVAEREERSRIDKGVLP
jgi:hypothetical protein